jgi:hypothetical protein
MLIVVRTVRITVCRFLKPVPVVAGRYEIANGFNRKRNRTVGMCVKSRDVQPVTGLRERVVRCIPVCASFARGYQYRMPSDIKYTKYPVRSMHVIINGFIFISL